MFDWKSHWYIKIFGILLDDKAPVGRRRSYSQKMAAEMVVFRVSSQQMPISQNLSYIYPNEICHGTIENSNELKHSSLPCDELGRVIESIKTRFIVPR